jgi:hypothetical protein
MNSSRDASTTGRRSSGRISCTSTGPICAPSRYKGGPSKSWLKAKCFAAADLEVLGVVREQAEAPLALLAADGSRKYVGAAIGLNRAMRKRLWERVAGMPRRAPKGIPIKKHNAQWIKPAWSGMSAIWKARAACGAL